MSGSILLNFDVTRLNRKLIIAAEKGNLKKVRSLLKQGADIHILDDLAVRLAAENGHLRVVRYLVETTGPEQGANIHSNNDYALYQASVRGHLPVVQYLVEQGANIDTRYFEHYPLIIKSYLKNVLKQQQLEHETREAYHQFVSQFQIEPPHGRFPGGSKYRVAREEAVSRGMRNVLMEIDNLDLESPWELIEEIGHLLGLRLPSNKIDAIEYLKEYSSQY